jgi:hypothetical protein
MKLYRRMGGASGTATQTAVVTKLAVETEHATRQHGAARTAHIIGTGTEPRPSDCEAGMLCAVFSDVL